MSDSKNYLSNPNARLVFISLLFAQLAALISENLLFSILLMFIIVGNYVAGFKLGIPLIIISLLTLTSEFFSEYRTYLTFIAFSYMLFIFIIKFGLNIEAYPKIPKQFIMFAGLLFATLFISTITSNYFYTSVIATIRTLIFFLLVYLFFSQLKNFQSVYLFIYSLIIVLILKGIPLFLDLYNVGIQFYFQRIFLSSFIELYSSMQYTGYTVFFITIIFILSMFFIKKFQTFKWKLFLSMLFVFNTLVLILANSRGGLLAAVAGILFLMFKLKKSLFTKILLYGSLISLLIIIAIPSLSNILSIYLRLETVGERELYWKSGIMAVDDYTLFGSGPDTFDKIFFNYAPSTIMRNYRPESIVQGKPHPHNFFLLYIAENGVLGGITSILFFVLLFFYCKETLNRTKNINRNYYILSVAITGIVLGIFIRSFIEVSGFLLYGYITRDLPFWLSIAILIYININVDKESIH